MIEKLDLYIGMAIAGLFTGLGSTLGSYLANKHIIELLNRANHLILKNKHQNDLNKLPELKKEQFSGV